MPRIPIVIDDDSPLTSPPRSNAQSSVPQTPPPQWPKPRGSLFFVAPPILNAQKKRQYQPLSKISFAGPSDTRVDEVIGEYQDGKTLYYFARYDGGIAHKFVADSFSEKYPTLVEKYEDRKAQGTLARFDPSASYVHPLSRVRVKIRISSDQMSRTSRSEAGGSDEVIPDSEDEESEDEDEDVDELDDDDDDLLMTRRSQPHRSTRKKVKDLPFSPRKTRSQKVITIHGSDSESSYSDFDSEDGSPQPKRRSTRARKTTEIQLESDEDFIDYGADSQSDAPSRSIKILGPKKTAARRKTIMPMYGRIRDIKTIDEDPYSDDEENEVLRRHRGFCEKCHDVPTHKLLQKFRKKSKGKGKKRKRGDEEDDFEWSDEEERYNNLGGWVQCLKCAVVAHWGCLAGSQQDEVLKAVRERDHEALKKDAPKGEEVPLPRKRKRIEVEETTEFVCGSCMRGGICLGCMETALEMDPTKQAEENAKAKAKEKDDDDDVVMRDVSEPQVDRSIAKQLFFRCFTCKRLCHYEHLPKPFGLENSSVAEVALHYQTSKSWLCADCSSYKYGLDKIIAWRPYPSNAVEPPLKKGEKTPSYKSQLPREYLVKWTARSYRRLNWVPHMWLLSTHPGKLKHFITGGTKVQLLEEPVQDDEDAMKVDGGSTVPSFEKEVASVASEKLELALVSPAAAMLDAERRIPPPWKTVHRVLDVNLWRIPVKKATKPKATKGKAQAVVQSSGEDDDEEMLQKRYVFEHGEQPSARYTSTVDEWEKDKALMKGDVVHVVWAFIKWDELGYDEATWDAPPRPGEPGYEHFKHAFEKFIDSRTVLLPVKDQKWWSTYDKRPKDGYRANHMLKEAADLALGQPKNLNLMPFQVDGFNWLCNNWWNHQPCILADEMGLGKTVQIVTFLGNIEKLIKATPALVVVPNSTITNWVREFERWAPHLRVVPFYGEKNARDVIKRFELFHDNVPKGHLKTKFNVLITTYETFTTTKDAGPVFKSQPRWEVLVIDEGQRLKNDNSLLFRKLNELKTVHRIIMTGTPLNNNIRELFNLMNFLDPAEWRDLEALEKQHEELTEELIKDLHNRLRPYFLRRIKSEVLELPPKNEVIVPVSMAPLQREVYRSILSNNLEILKGLTQPSGKQNAPAKTRINNVLMQLRKCLQHPYLYDQDIEPGNLSPQETHEKLIDASAKLRFLKVLLPKLKERGHRVLLFSQFVIALNVIEDFLAGEGFKFLRLDGNTKGSVRQKSMDDFNKPNSEFFIFLLTTRAGGVGINLFTADTVIIFDPDFNPHQDLQAIARSYRYGQKKTCMVFKLMVKDSAEERIIQVGKKKLVLDHLIVQKMDDDDENGGEDVNSILTYGAQALFESDQSQAERDINYSEQDIDKLIEKTQSEAVTEGPKGEGGGLSFNFAKVWAADKDNLEEVVEKDQTDSWAQALQKLNEAKEIEQQRQLAESGRGGRRKAADKAKARMSISAGGSLLQDKKRSKSRSLDGSAYSISDHSDIEMDSDGTGTSIVDEDFGIPDKGKQKKPLVPIHNVAPETTIECGLCGQQHGTGQCVMIEKSENLAEYREMLILHADDEPWEERCAAIDAIDDILIARGDIKLIAGQPLRPLPAPLAGPSAPKKAKKPAQPRHPRSEALNNSLALLNGEQPKPKKTATPMPSSPCILCHKNDPHHYKDCAIVRAGSRSISTAIQHLESRKDPSLVPTIDTLRPLLAKAKAREIAGDTTNGAGPSRMPY